MKVKNYPKVGSILVLGLLMVNVLYVHALNNNVVEATTQSTVENTSLTSCLVFQTGGLRYLTKDQNSNGEVTKLQNFLFSQGYLKQAPTGYFGIQTLAAVKSFQAKNGVDQTGYVGSVTKSKIGNISCGNKRLDQVGVVACTNEQKLCANGQAMKRNTDCSWDESSCSGILKPSTQNNTTLTPSLKVIPGPTPTVKELPKILPTVACTQELRTCPNGSPMPRFSDCMWLPEKCAPVLELTPQDRVGRDPLPPAKKPVFASSSPIVCTTEVRLCPNGEAMYRDSSCGWHPEKCAPVIDGGGMECKKNPTTGIVTCGVSTQLEAL